MSDLAEVPRSFRRDPGAPFDDFRVESFCKARAKGGTVAASGTHAGIVKQTAMKWEKEPEVRTRIRELRDGAEDFVGVSVAWILNQLKINVKEAREAGAMKASNEALLISYKIISENKQVAHQMASALPAALEGRDLQRALRESFAQPEDVVDTVLEDSQFSCGEERELVADSLRKSMGGGE